MEVLRIGGLPPIEVCQRPAAGEYVWPGYLHDPDDASSTSGTTGNLTSDTLYVQPFIPRFTVTFDRLGIRTGASHTATAATVIQAIYLFDMVTRRPTTKLYTGTVQTLAAVDTTYLSTVAGTLYRGVPYAVVTHPDFSTGNCLLRADAKASNNNIPAGLATIAGTSTFSGRGVTGSQTGTAYDGTLADTFPAGTLTMSGSLLTPTAYLRVA